ncbi:MAG TPA: DUF2868 domain-containing protein, partial [Ramlibacter sp.]|nr:DUF2868 domain-containing protein [Ramlibacter sp.]
MNEATARRISLAQAIETADSQHRLLGVAQRRQIDAQELREAGPSRQPPTPADLEDFLDRRARLLLAAVQESHPAVAALQQPPAWPRRLAIAAPVAALLAGLLTDRIANPHRVDLLSLPLLGIVLWNLVLYALMLGRWLLVRSPGTGPAWPGLRHALDGWLAGRYRRAPQDVRLAFALLWSRLAAGLQRLRLERVLHLCAAGLAAGVLLSLVTRGLVVEYRVGWESTFLDAPQVHRLLRLLLAPADALLPWPPYSVDEIARLRFGESGGAPNAARWVVLHAVLLLELVVLPRLLLAGWSWWRERRLAARLALDLEQPYFQHLVAQRWPARIVLGLHAPDPGARATAVRLLRQPAQEKDMSQEGELLLSSAEGDTLLLRELAQLPAPAPIETESGWTQRLRGRWGRGRAQRTTLSTAPFDLLLLAVATPDELVAAAPALPGL